MKNIITIERMAVKKVIMRLRPSTGGRVETPTTDESSHNRVRVVRDIGRHTALDWTNYAYRKADKCLRPAGVTVAVVFRLRH